MRNNDERDRFHIRKHPRLKHYDYSQPGYYFITICTNNKRCIFGGPARLGKFGQIAQQAFSEIEVHFHGVRVDKFVVMPNHVHAIMEVLENGNNLSLVIGHYKAYVTKLIRIDVPETKVWQASFHDHVIRGQRDYERIWKYIDSNPAKWQEDCFYCE